ncbi:putative holin-like toxin [Apilactobacillus micheneri]
MYSIILGTFIVALIALVVEIVKQSKK